MSYSLLGNNNAALNAPSSSSAKPAAATMASNSAQSTQSPDEFSKELIKISISHLLFHLGFDRIHGAALGVFVSVLLPSTLIVHPSR